MPRQARLDAPGLLQHVMARGIERREIFKDDKDRKSFLNRLATILEETQTQCFAWALIPNHFHLLLHTGATPLSKVMRRLMTGYAVSFNRRHKRSGHLFQNRYKSVVCEEDPYLLELIRYIHLNALRAELVKDLKELDKYSWTGHSGILGRRKNPLIPDLPKKKGPSADRQIAFSQFHPGIEKAKVNPEHPAAPRETDKVTARAYFTGVNPASPVEAKRRSRSRGPVAPADGTGIKCNKSLAQKTIEDVLLHFGDTLKVARRSYRQFVKNGINQGTRLELQGGGLVRSAGGHKAGLLGRKKEEREKGDERILGSGDFVSKIIQESEKRYEKTASNRIALKALIQKVAQDMGISPIALLSQSRDRNVSRARAVISYLATKEAGYTQTEIKNHLDISRIGVRNSILRAEEMIDTCQRIWEKIV